MLVGPLLARFGRALISKPGGDKIGRRRLDTHFLGISNWEQNSLMIQPEVIFRIQADHLKGAICCLMRLP